MLCLLSVLDINTSVVVGYSTSLLRSVCSLSQFLCLLSLLVLIAFVLKKRKGNFPNA